MGAEPVLVRWQETSDIVKATIGAEDVEGLQLRYPEFILSLEAPTQHLHPDSDGYVAHVPM